MAASFFQHRHRVTYADCTVGNHVYYGRYLALLEAARGEFFRHLGTPFADWQAAGAIFPVVECRLRYRAAARYDDELTVDIGVAELGRVRINFGYRIRNQAGTEILEAETSHACTSFEDRPQRVPDKLARLLAPYVS